MELDFTASEIANELLAQAAECPALLVDWDLDEVMLFVQRVNADVGNADAPPTWGRMGQRPHVTANGLAEAIVLMLSQSSGSGVHGRVLVAPSSMQYFCHLVGQVALLPLQPFFQRYAGNRPLAALFILPGPERMHQAKFLKLPYPPRDTKAIFQ